MHSLISRHELTVDNSMVVLLGGKMEKVEEDPGSREKQPVRIVISNKCVVSVSWSIIA